MIVTGENLSDGGKILSYCHFLHRKSTRELIWDRTRTPAIEGDDAKVHKTCYAALHWFTRSVILSKPAPNDR